MDSILFAVGAVGAGVLCFMCGVMLSSDVQEMIKKLTFRGKI